MLPRIVAPAILISLLVLLCNCAKHKTIELVEPSDAQEYYPNSENTVISPYDEPPSLLKPLVVEYPQIAKEGNIEGTVVLELVITKLGVVQSVKVVRSDSALLEQAAIDSVEGMLFSPGRSSGAAVDTIMLLPITFSLK
jgi:TonB family protein